MWKAEWNSGSPWIAGRGNFRPIPPCHGEKAEKVKRKPFEKNTSEKNTSEKNIKSMLTFVKASGMIYLARKNRRSRQRVRDSGNLAESKP